MSYNATGVDVIAAENFAIGTGPEVLEVLGECRVEDAPEAGQRFEAGQPFPWSGNFSGRDFDTLVEQVLPRCTGSADLVVTWEGGDSFSGIRVRDGVVTKHKVVMTLGDETKDWEITP